MVTGPNRAKIANQLAKKLPFEIVLPLTVVNMPSVDNLYVRHGETLEGPYSVEEIQKKMAEARRL
jgi:hypothetical protein